MDKKLNPFAILANAEDDIAGELMLLEVAPIRNIPVESKRVRDLDRAAEIVAHAYQYLQNQGATRHWEEFHK